LIGFYSFGVFFYAKGGGGGKRVAANLTRKSTRLGAGVTRGAWEQMKANEKQTMKQKQNKGM
jgi:hypothetical protein